MRHERVESASASECSVSCFDLMMSMIVCSPWWPEDRMVDSSNFLSRDGSWRRVVNCVRIEL